MFELACLSNNSRFSVALNILRGDAQVLDGFLSEEAAQFFTNGHELVQIFAVTSCVGVFYYGDCEGASCGRFNILSHFLLDFVNVNRDFSYFCLHCIFLF